MCLALTGACGTVSHFAVCEMAAKAKNSPIPLGTFTVNIVGSFLFGLIYILAQRRIRIEGLSCSPRREPKMAKNATFGGGVLALGAGALVGSIIQPGALPK